FHRSPYKPKVAFHESCNQPRRVLRQTLSLSDATRQWGNTAGLVAGLMKGDLGLVGRSMEDKVAEPVRSLLIPGYAQVRQAALGAGAIGCGISGSGPTMFALCEDHADSVGEAMVQAFRTVGLSGTVFHSKLNPAGAALI
ncbi:MAG: homoserine kinase, partial [Bacteroidota bacterium]